MKNLLLIGVCLVLMGGATFRLGEKLYTYPKNYNLIALDVLGNVLLASAHELDKYDADGKLLGHFSELSNGEIHDLDASDALNTLVYYKDFQKLVFLNKDLSPKSDPVDLTDLGYSEVRLVCSSFNSGFWLWDEQSRQLIHFTNQLDTDRQSGDINAMCGTEVQAVKMREGNHHLVLLDPHKGFFLFDRFGAYLKHLPFTGVKDFQLVGDELCFLQGDQLHCYNPQNLQQQSIQLGSSEFTAFQIADKQILLKDQNDRVMLFSLDR